MWTEFLNWLIETRSITVCLSVLKDERLKKLKLGEKKCTKLIKGTGNKTQRMVSRNGQMVREFTCELFKIVLRYQGHYKY